MTDRRKHRGAHPKDQSLFGTEAVPILQQATQDLNWLLSRRYVNPSALKLVGDRYNLDARQRTAVSRCACSSGAKKNRVDRQINCHEIADQTVWIDGYNILISIETALSGGVILHASDGCYRDMASLHGTYRSVEETAPALELVGKTLDELRVKNCRWLLDQPVSNSGRLKTAIQDVARDNQWSWTVDLVPDPDPILAIADQIVVSSDSQILDHCRHWFNLVGHVIDHQIEQPWIVDLHGT